jgi:lysylphosphatidylglycerol synthetase-like protein (DUF2156 family)
MNPAFIDHPSGFLALSPRNQQFTAPGLPGFIAYREQGKHLVALGGVHAPEPARAPLLDRFLDEAARRRRRVIALQVRQSQAELFRARGFTVNQFGASFGLKLSAFSLAGGRRVKLRNKLRRARAAGLCIVELGRDVAAGLADWARLAEISAAWLGKKRKKELDFLVGELGAPGDPQRRVFAAKDAHGRLLGFITYVPVWGERPGYLHDLTRRLPDAPPGAMELCNAHAIDRFRAENVEYLHFGLTPFLLDGPEGPRASRLLAWALRLIGRYGRALYPARSQLEYKLKWGPDVVERELIACRPLSLRAVIDLLLLTRSI